MFRSKVWFIADTDQETRRIDKWRRAFERSDEAMFDMDVDEPGQDDPFEDIIVEQPTLRSNHIVRSDIAPWLDAFVESIEHVSYLIYNPVEESDASSSSSACIGSVVINFTTQAAGETFYKRYHNRHFGETESKHSIGPVCYVLFLSELRVGVCNSVDELRDTSQCRRRLGTPLPACPFCLERLDVTVTGIITGKHGWLEMSSGWNKAEWCECCKRMRCTDGQMVCEECGAPQTEDAPMWICLICGHVGCGRYTKAACAKHHALEVGHSLCMEISNGRIWDYRRDAFVHRRLVQESGRMLDLDPAAESSSPESSADNHMVRRAIIEQGNGGTTARSELDILLSSQIEEERRRYEEACAELEAVGQSRSSHERYLMEMVDMPELEETGRLLKEKKERITALRHEIRRHRRLHDRKTKELNDLQEVVGKLLAEKRSLEKRIRKTPLVSIDIEDDREVRRLRQEVDELTLRISNLDNPQQ
ncbi:hypothetical protein FOL47_006215 [Perkinsus chesapeaki]|uniref:UBP-type domain-containing protein n=1 Tax=Perkinsus chesapeaki TaxID=330153 RepID=A0A7J6LU31_PERCH|nr:hypothetical protein FOL47_006215 [Perkinsus chesapeaki]